MQWAIYSQDFEFVHRDCLVLYYFMYHSIFYLITFATLYFGNPLYLRFCRKAWDV